MIGFTVGAIDAELHVIATNLSPSKRLRPRILELRDKYYPPHEASELSAISQGCGRCDSKGCRNGPLEAGKNAVPCPECWR